jgi:hypothetical protein
MGDEEQRAARGALFFQCNFWAIGDETYGDNIHVATFWFKLVEGATYDLGLVQATPESLAFGVPGSMVYGLTSTGAQNLLGYDSEGISQRLPIVIHNNPYAKLNGQGGLDEGVIYNSPPPPPLPPAPPPPDWTAPPGGNPACTSCILHSDGVWGIMDATWLIDEVSDLGSWKSYSWYCVEASSSYEYQSVMAAGNVAYQTSRTSTCYFDTNKNVDGKLGACYCPLLIPPMPPPPPPPPPSPPPPLPPPQLPPWSTPLYPSYPVGRAPPPSPMPPPPADNCHECYRPHRRTS